MFHNQLNNLPYQVIWLKKLLINQKKDQPNLNGFLVFSQDSTEWLVKHELNCHHEDEDYNIRLSTSLGYITNHYKGIDNLKSLMNGKGKKVKHVLNKMKDVAWYVQHVWDLSWPINRSITLHTSLGGHTKWFKEDKVYVIIDDTNLSIENDKTLNEKYVYLAAWLSYENSNKRLIKKLSKNVVHKLYLKLIDTLSYQDDSNLFLNWYQNKSSWLNVVSLDLGLHFFLLIPDKYRLNSFLSKVSYLLIQVISRERLIFTDMLGKNGWGYCFLRLKLKFKVINLLLTCQVNNVLDVSFSIKSMLNVREQLLVV